MKIIKLILLILCINATSSIAQGFRGIVTDEKDETVPFATIYLKETTTGTTTNDLGEFDIQLEAGSYTVVFQGLGFQKQEIKIEVKDGYVEKNIQLKKQAYRIKEVRVYSGGEDPAYPIMRKAISLAPYYQRQTSQYKAEVYLKGSLVMNKIPKLIKRMMDKEEDDAAKLEIGKTYTMESMNEIEFTAPDKYDHTVINSQSTFPGSNDDDVIGYITYSFYEPNQDMAVSPLAPNSFSHYKFVYEGFFYEGDVTVNKIKIVPKRKSQQSYSGYIYIVDNLWNIHSIDVTNNAFFGEINIKQVYAPVKERSWLPISHRFKVKASIMGVKADFRYAGSVKYSDIALNSDLPVPATLMKQYAAEEAALEAEQQREAEEKAEIEKSRAERKMEELLAKEELSNREMIKLSRLIEKESRKQEMDKEESLEIKDTYKITHKKDTVKRDSMYWENMRPIPLTSDELKSFEVKDSLKLVKLQNDTAKVKKKEKSAFAKASDGFLSGHTFYAADSALRITYDGLIGLDQVDFNAVDGWSYNQSMQFRYKIDSVRNVYFKPMVQYAFNRDKLLWEGRANYSFAPLRRANIGIGFGQVSRDFNSKYGIDRTLNMFAALFFKEHYMKLYQKDYVSIYHAIDPMHGMRLNVGASYSYYHQLENSTNWSIAYPNADYAENIPPNDQIIPEHMQSQSDMHIYAKLSYTPRMRYRMWKGKKYHRGSRYPTFSVGYERGLKDVMESDSDYELINADIKQSKEWGIFNEFNWQVGGGYFTRNKQMHFSRFQHFNTNEIPLSFKEWSNTFNLLEDYSYSTNEWYAKAHVSYTSPYLLLKFLPWVSNRLWNENLYASYLTQPNFKNYTEVGYGISQIFLMGSVGTFVGFENGKYRSWGFKVSLNFD
ncbi:DUF5686 family protein [Carboxylicivirga sp. N1Y90]|uniref:DUF5686 family protein n=1 Tax=Carboxylicivirga fragile TaxID=3417571 RepID=UPI003D33A678|nr:carboxypeptidase-like regulatory domain-containing protein [Marinilabiliaceae bacterium N1Y90]